MDAFIDAFTRYAIGAGWVLAGVAAWRESRKVTKIDPWRLLLVYWAFFSVVRGGMLFWIAVVGGLPWPVFSDISRYLNIPLVVGVLLIVRNRRAVREALVEPLMEA